MQQAFRDSISAADAIAVPPLRLPLRDKAMERLK